MISRGASLCLKSRILRPNLSSAKLNPELLDPTKFLILSPTTHAPSVSPTPKSRREIPSSWILRKTWSLSGSRANPDTLPMWLVETTSAELDKSYTSNVTSVHTTLCTSRTTTERLLLQENLTFLLWVQRSHWSHSQRVTATTSTSLRRRPKETKRSANPVLLNDGYSGYLYILILSYIKLVDWKLLRAMIITYHLKYQQLWVRWKLWVPVMHS